MPIKRSRSWDIPESRATPEAVYLNRREIVAGLGLAGLIAAAPARAAAPADPTADLYPAKRNPRYTLDRPLTEEVYPASYNNFYEFGSSKSIASAAKALKTRPWTVAIDGMVEKPFTIGIDDLVRKMPLEERLYRHRCVEAWAMAVPWTGFPMKALVDLAKPLSSARYVRTETFVDRSVAPGQRQIWFPWPYTEGLTLAEATNDLAFIATGIYGKPLLNQFGAPLRLVTPWKYGFKSAKSLVRFVFTDQRPKSYWEALGPNEYGFWANVNPEVPHPRWSQASERMLGSDEMRPTLLYNGYGAEVAGLYKGLDQERLFM